MCVRESERLSMSVSYHGTELKVNDGIEHHLEVVLRSDDGKRERETRRNTEGKYERERKLEKEEGEQCRKRTKWVVIGMFSGIVLLLFFATIFLYRLSGRSQYFEKVNMTLNITKHLLRLGKDIDAIDGIALTVSPTFSLATPYVLHELLENLPPRWMIVCVTEYGASLLKKEKIIHEIFRSVNARRDGKDIVILPLLPPSFTIHLYSCLLMSPSFYLSLPTEHILIFQWDSLLLRHDDGNTDRQTGRYEYLRDFFDFPYIGAPWRWRGCREPFHLDSECRDGGNGGFSLRRRSAMINVTSSPDFNPEYKPGDALHSILIASHKPTHTIPLPQESAVVWRILSSLCIY